MTEEEETVKAAREAAKITPIIWSTTPGITIPVGGHFAKDGVPWILGKHWRATSMGAHCHCSPEADHNILVDPHLMEFHVDVCQDSSN